MNGIVVAAIWIVVIGLSVTVGDLHKRVCVLEGGVIVGADEFPYIARCKK